MICEFCKREFFEDWRKDKNYRKQAPTPRFCSRTCSSRFVNSISKNRKKSTGRPRGTPSKFKGATKEISEIYKKVSIANTGKPGHFTGRHHSVETREKISEKISKLHEEKGHGGFRDVKYYYIKNIDGEEFSVRGTWELKYAEWLNSKKILWVRRIYLKYEKDGVVKHYCPDFFIPADNKFIEIKGFFSKKDKEKLILVEEKHNIKIEILQERELKSLGIL